MVGALSQIRVLDFSQGHGGPYCTMQLADAGAEVIKVEPPDGDWARALPPFVGGESAYFMAINRNKKSIVLDLKQPHDLEAALAMAKRCDVVVENFRPGVADRLGIGYEAIAALNPGVVYCSVTALDSDGPEHDLPATELTVQARGGIMRNLGLPGEPPIRFGEDGLAAATGNYAAQAVVAALFHRAKTGEGQRVGASMLRSVMHLQKLTFTMDCEPDGGRDDPRRRVEETTAGFTTKDLPIGFSFPYMLVGYPTEERWREFCARVGLQQIVDDPRFATNFDRTQNAAMLREYYEDAFKDRTSAELLAILEDLGALNAVYTDYPNLFNHPQVIANDMVEEVDHPTAGRMKTVGFPTKLFETPAQIRTAAPLLGEHTGAVLDGLAKG